MATSHDRGDPDEALREFVRVAWPRLLRTGWLLCGDRDEAEDLVQSALVSVVRAWPRIERKDDPYVYARTVLFNTAASRWSRRRRLEELLAGRRDPGPVPDHAGRIVLHDAIWRALATLPPRTRAILVLRYFEDLTEAQTAAVLACSVGSVKSQASRGLARLRTQLDGQDLVPFAPGDGTDGDGGTSEPDRGASRNVRGLAVSSPVTRSITSPRPRTSSPLSAPTRRAP